MLSAPRLELSAALLLARLIHFVRVALQLSNLECYCWSDSTIAFTWLNQSPSRWKTFVPNRVSAVQLLLPGVSWCHVPTKTNPADGDCASHGLAPDMFEKHNLWWSTSPPWGCIILLSVGRICALRYRPMSFSNNSEPVCTLDSVSCWDLDSRYSSWPELLRITAHLYRFLNRFRMLLECTFTCSEFAFRENPKSQTLLAHNHAIRHISQWNLGSNMAVFVI